MDFQSLKRRELQFLCKMNNIPANITNAAMIDALSLLTVVEGLEEFMGKPEFEAEGSPERSVITSPTVPLTTTRRKALKEVECSGLATRTRRGTKTKANEGTETRKTPATRTTRRRESQEASAKKDMEKDLQADFEADLEQQSEVSENSVLLGELKEISEEVSGVSLENEGQLSENQNKIEIELQQSEDEQEVNKVDDLIVSEAQEESFESKVDLHSVTGNEDKEVNGMDDLIVSEAQEEPSESKVDFHSLTRKDLQNLCKKNKIPANMTNAAMADALASLETVEGLKDFVTDFHSQVLSSPLVSGVATSCARRSRTTLRTTKEEPKSSKIVTKSCRGSRRRILEEDEQVKNDDVSESPIGSALCESESQNKEESIVSGSESKQLDISNMDDNECPSVFNNGELEVTESSEVLGVGELSSNTNNSEDNVLNVDENVVEESSKDAELENNQVQNTITFETDDANESNDPILEDLVNAPSLTSEDQISKEFISESNEHINSEGVVAALEVEVGDHVEDEFSEKSNFISSVQTDELSLDSNKECESESEDSDFESESEDSDFESESEGSCTEEDMSEKSDIEITTEGNKVREVGAESESDSSSTEDDTEDTSDSESVREVGAESESDGSNTEDDTEDKSDSESESESSFTEDDKSLKPDIETINQAFTEEDKSSNPEIETITQGDKHVETNLASELEGNGTEEKKLDSESISQDQEIDEEIDTEEKELDFGAPKSDFCAPLEKNQFEKKEITLDSSTYENEVSNKIDINTVQAELCVPVEQETPLPFKSMRKLKRILKEKLQAAALAKSMENLTLEETNKPIAEKDEDSHTLLEKLSENPEESEEGGAFQENLEDEALSNNNSKNATTLYPVEIIVDNEVIPENVITGNIDVITCPPQSTPTKVSSNIKQQPLLFTPPSKKPVSAGRKNCVLDVNKENINSAASKTEPGKVKAVNESGKLLSAMSMGKLKKEFKVLQQQSEKKRQALQSRLDNNCFLTSP